MNETEIINRFNGDFSELSKLIKSWNLIQANSKSEFNGLTEKILENLYENQNETKIERIIESELRVTYGMYKTEFNSKKLANEIMNWWNE